MKRRLKPNRELASSVRQGGRALKIAVAAGGAIACVAFLTGSASLRIVSSAPHQGDTIGGSTLCRVRFFGLPLSSRVSLDGRPVQARIDLPRQMLEAPLEHLAEGRHRLEVELASATTSVSNVTEFTVDTVAPRLSHLKPQTGTATQESTLTLHGMTEPDCRLSIRDEHGKVLEEAVADKFGKFVARISLQDGMNHLEVEARDRAGNRSALAWDIFADRSAPTLQLSAGGKLVQDGSVLATDAVNVSIAGADDDRVARCNWSLDGSVVHRLGLMRRADSWVGSIHLSNLAEGERVLNVTVADRSGRTTQESWRFIVDSTEELGHKTLTRGARGRDVAALQQELVGAGMLDGSQVTSMYDDETVAAVERLQTEQSLAPVDGIAGPAVLGAMGPRIFIDLARFGLVLDRPGQPLVRYRIACGMPAHPTPTGRFSVAYKEKNPTWLPPHSIWAREAKITPPGPGNPLGTRWIGLSSGEVGIHGTNAAWTVGSRASHGCIRMTIPDVENLFDKVDPGTPVTILNGNEKDPAIQKYWP